MMLGNQTSNVIVFKSLAMARQDVDMELEHLRLVDAKSDAPTTPVSA